MLDDGRVLGITCGVMVYGWRALRFGLHLIIENGPPHDHCGRRRPVFVLDGLSDAARRAGKTDARRLPHIELASGRSLKAADQSVES